MILPDANLILYAHIKDLPQHNASRTWLQKVITDGEIIGLSWQVITAFIRIGTNPKLFKSPMTMPQIERSLDTLLSLSNVRLVTPSEQHWNIFLNLLKESNAVGNLVMDAHLAALAIEHNARLASTDQDFKIFSGLNYYNPLVED